MGECVRRVVVNIIIKTYILCEFYCQLFGMTRPALMGCGFAFIRLYHMFCVRRSSTPQITQRGTTDDDGSTDDTHTFAKTTDALCNQHKYATVLILSCSPHLLKGPHQIHIWRRAPPLGLAWRAFASPDPIFSPLAWCCAPQNTATRLLSFRRPH